METHSLPLRERFRWAEEILLQSRVFMTEKQIRALIVRLVAQIKNELSMLYPVVLSVMSGSLMFSSDLMRHIDFPIDFDYLAISRYRQFLHPDDLQWLVYPRIPLQGRRVLLLDDILDQGVTLKSIYDWLLNQGVEGIKIAVLCQRHKEIDMGISADYIGTTIYDDSFVFGYGMDIYGFWRNLPALYCYDGHQQLHLNSGLPHGSE